MIYEDGLLKSTLFVDLPVIHGFTTRSLGSLGYGKNPGDIEVTANRKRLFQSLRLENRRHIQPRQVHSAKCIDASEFVPGVEADASVSRSSQDLLSILTADCVPILIYHPSGMVAAVHAGWRGLHAGIIPAALKLMPAGGIAVIGPSIGACCYEVSQDLADDFASKYGEEVVLMREKPHLDLIQAAILDLQESGISEIDACQICTRCHPELFFSYRREGSSGRLMSFIGLSRKD